MLGVFPCQGKGSPPQLMSLSNAGHLRRETNCAEVKLAENLRRGNVMMYPCNERSSIWLYENSMLKDKTSGLCLSTAGLKAGEDIIVEACDSSNPHQLWSFVDPNL
ncbi:unnamed protein product [Strongylus vulgaris]|uniref:Ricin B lectin domain-containing protein n=1 Tax=Strongylus vulgaris TaxID=40348 RepID=A0A3P7LVC1_STRVU|nr:unnamed protein product [Strongylus vulgaris]